MTTTTIAIPMKGIRFIHYIDPQIIDRMCKEYDFVQVSFSAYNNERYADGKIHREKKVGFGSQIRSSKDVVQFNNEDMKVMTDKTRKELR